MDTLGSEKEKEEKLSDIEDKQCNGQKNKRYYACIFYCINI